MDKMRFQLKLSYRVEMLGTGHYRSLAAGCEKKHPDLAKALKEYAEHEYEHGELFKKCYVDMYKKNPASEGFWLGVGKCMTAMSFALPLKLKLKNASLVEKLAVKQLERDIKTGAQNRYIEIAKKILPDEKKHADLYADWSKKI
jgi:hypothetical protein